MVGLEQSTGDGPERVDRVGVSASVSWSSPLLPNAVGSVMPRRSVRVSQAPGGIDVDDGFGEIRHEMEKVMMDNFSDLVRPSERE